MICLFVSMANLIAEPLTDKKSVSNRKTASIPLELPADAPYEFKIQFQPTHPPPTIFQKEGVVIPKRSGIPLSTPPGVKV